MSKITDELYEEIIVELDRNNASCGNFFLNQLANKHHKTPEGIKKLYSNIKCCFKNLQDTANGKNGKGVLSKATQELWASTFDKDKYKKNKQWSGVVQILYRVYKLMEKLGLPIGPNINCKTELAVNQISLGEGKFLPTKDYVLIAIEQVHSELKKNTGTHAPINYDAILDQVEKNAINDDKSLKPNWRKTTEEMLDDWS